MNGERFEIPRDWQDELAHAPTEDGLITSGEIKRVIAICLVAAALALGIVTVLAKLTPHAAAMVLS